MTSKEKVLAKYPKAHAWSSWMQHGRWFVSTDTDERVSIMEFAVGLSEPSAWDDAASRLEAAQNG